MLLARMAFRAMCRRIVVNGDPGLLQRKRDIGYETCEDGTPVGGIFDKEIE